MCIRDRSKGITFRTFLMIGYFFVAMNMTHQQLIHEVNLVCPEGEEGEYTLGTTLTSCHTTVFYNKVFRCDKIIYDLNLEIGLCAMCRDIIAEEMFESSQDYMIGGPGTTVEVDESMFGRCCYYTSQHYNIVHYTKPHHNTPYYISLHITQLLHFIQHNALHYTPLQYTIQQCTVGKRKYRRGRITGRRQCWILGGVCR